MKKTKKLISIILAVIMVLSSFCICATAFDAEQVTEIPVSVTAGEDESAEGGIAAFFEELFAKIKKVILIIVGNISIAIDRSYSKLDYADYSSDAFDIPGLDEGFVPQGVCYVEELDSYAISGYVKGENSRIYIISKESGDVKKLILKGFSKHAGGIASDGSDVWVCAGGNENEGGFIYHLTTQTILAAADGEEIEFDGSFQTQVRASALCCDGERLYVAEFYEEDDYPVNPDHKNTAGSEHNAWAIGYDLPIAEAEYDGSENAPDLILSIPDKVQGMAVTADGNIVFSTSYGRFYDSTLHIYKPLDEWISGGVVLDGAVVHLCIADEKSLISKVKMPTLMEGIDAEGDTLYAVFESGAEAYADAKEIHRAVIAVNINKVIEAL